MSTISKNERKQPKKRPLTPWQQANLEYMQKKAAENKEKATKEETNVTPLTPPSEKPVKKELTITGKSVNEESATKKNAFPDDAPPVPVDEPADTTDDLEEKLSFFERLPKDKQLYQRMGILIGLFLIPSLILGYYISPLSQLAGVTVQHNEHVSKATIKETVDLKLGDNLWPQYFDREAKVARLEKKEARIKSATIKFNGANRFVIDVNEYEEVAFLEHNGAYSPIIANGKVMPVDQKKATGDLPILENFKGSKRILAVLAGYKKLSEEIQQGISQIKYAPSAENRELLQIFMNDGNQVLVSINELDKKMAYYPQVVKQMNKAKFKGVVDMEAGIYSYPYPNEKKTKSTHQNTTSQSEELRENE